MASLFLQKAIKIIESTAGSKMILRNKENLLILVASLVSIIPYLTAFRSEPIMVDYTLIIEPLKDIRGIIHYFNMLIDGDLYDIQPIRDFSHLFDIWLENIFTFNQVGLLQNILILFLTSFFIFRISLFFLPKKISLFLALIFIFHPLSFNVYVQITSRKHILSFLFFLLSFF